MKCNKLLVFLYLLSAFLGILNIFFYNQNPQHQILNIPKEKSALVVSIVDTISNTRFSEYTLKDYDGDKFSIVDNRNKYVVGDSVCVIKK